MRPNSAGDSSGTTPRGRARGQARNPLDERLARSARAGLPGLRGVALGFDRLVMAAWRLPSLDAAMAFPASRA